MADSSSSGKPDPLDILLNGNPMIKSVEESIQQTMTNYMKTADAEISKLVEANLLPPDTVQEMQALHKATIDKTMEIIKASPVSWPTADSGKK